METPTVKTITEKLIELVQAKDVSLEDSHIINTVRNMQNMHTRALVLDEGLEARLHKLWEKYCGNQK